MTRLGLVVGEKDSGVLDLPPPLTVPPPQPAPLVMASVKAAATAVSAVRAFEDSKETPPHKPSTTAPNPLVKSEMSFDVADMMEEVASVITEEVTFSVFLFLVNAALRLTTLQSMMNAKLSPHRFWPCHENGLIKTIPTITHLC